MAKDTSLALRNFLIYQVYTRNHTKEGTFQALIKDLDRIKSLGTDIVYLLPIHPVGEKNRKGTLGSNYSIKDYRAINPELGTFEDFKDLIKSVHEKDMKIMMDIVFNHTSHDSVLLKEHPEWFYYRDGKNANRVGDWWDIIDLDFTSSKDLWEYLIETLEIYAKMGVDGFRCDVAPLIPLDFWLEARKRIAKINPNFIWLSESVHKSFIKYLRDLGFEAYSDGEVYQAFDILYDYDIHEEFLDFIKGGSLVNYLKAIMNQEAIYPANYVKLRFLENHDQERIASLVRDENILNNLTAFIFFVKGATMIYGGQEAYNTHRPSLFDKDDVDWSTYEEHNCVDLIRTMAKIKKDPIMATGKFNILLDYEPLKLIVMTYENKEKVRYGIFNVGNDNHQIELNISNGTYTNLVNNQPITYNGKLSVEHTPIVFDVIK